MSKLSIEREQLANGLTILKIDLPNFHSITNFLAIRSGSRYEDAKNNGIAHFLEHMVFKGTAKYANTAEIAQAIESVGGYFNAWTSLDHTAYWNVVPASQWKVGVDLPFELAFNPRLPAEDLERERGVILEEINMIQDDPARFVDDLSNELVFNGNPLGQHIIGTADNIRQMTIEQFREYREKFYLPSQTIFITIGNLQGKDIRALVEEKTAGLKAAPITEPERFAAPSRQAFKLVSKKTDQTHFMISIALPTLAIGGPDRFVGYVLNTLLGRGMSSRLFLNVREKHGLAYAVYSHLSELEDTGIISIYGGVTTEKVEKALAAIQNELDDLSNNLVEKVELSKAKEYVTGSFDLRSDQPVELAKWYGVGELFAQKESYEDAKKAIATVTAEQVKDLAKRLFAKEQQTLAVIGPFESDKIFRNFLATKQK